MKIRIRKPVFLALVAAVALSGSVAFAGDGKFSGYVDAEFGWWFTKGSSWQAPAQTPASNGLKAAAVPEAAVKYNWEGEGTTVMFDLPFTGPGYGTTVAASALNTAALQAFVKQQYSMGLWWQVGKFDHWVTYEANDADGRVFLRPGILVQQFGAGTTQGAAATIGMTHTGIGLGYNMEPISIGLLFANGTASGNAHMNSGSQYGGMIKFTSDSLWVDVAFILEYVSATVSATNIDAEIGFKTGALSIVGLFNMFSATGNTNNPLGFGALVGYGLSNTVDLSLRGEYVTNYAAAASSTGLAIAVGPQIKMNKNLALKAEFNFGSFSAGSLTDTGLTIGGVAKF